MPKFIISSLILFLAATFGGLVYLQAANYDIMSLLSVAIAATSLFAMSWALLLAAKLPWVERIFVGADRAYQAHRYLGYGAVIGFLSHWMIGFESLRGLVETNFSEFAEGIGVIPAISITALGVISALKLVPYHIWKYSHFAMGPLYAIAVFHSNFTPNPMLGTVLEPALWAISAIGILGWIITLLNHLNRGKKYEIIALHHGSTSIDMRLKAKGRVIKSKPGQFADIKMKSLNHQEFHPFTIAGQNQDELRFIIGKLGDDTQNMHQALKIGDEVRVKSARGNFVPNAQKKRQNSQIWIAAGVGITPFLASLNALSKDDKQTIELHYLVRSKKDGIALAELEKHQDRLANFKLHIYASDELGRLGEDAFTQMIKASHPSASLYMCAPENLKQSFRKIWQKQKMRGKIFEEKFDFRAAI